MRYSATCSGMGSRYSTGSIFPPPTKLTGLMLRALVLLCLGTAVLSAHPSAFDPQPLLELFNQQVDKALGRVAGQYAVYPDFTRQATPTSEWLWELDDGWTSGFWPGLLWSLGNQTGNSTYSTLSEFWTANRAVEASDNTTHDVGFMVFYSFGKGLELYSDLPNPAYYKAILLQTAQSLSERYSPIIGMTRSWGAISDMTQFEVIIDNLMNLELLFWAAANGGPQEFFDMAVSHADNTFKWWVRNDSSTFHLVVFNPVNGSVISRSATPQGLSVNSTWARGQAWGIYGFTMAYRYTGYSRYLAYAQNLTAYWFANVPSDQIPKWDFDAQPPNDNRDTSAAAITASAMLELAKFTGNQTYYDEAVAILTSLSGAPYLADPSTTEAVLTHNFHDCGSDDCTLIETDYYFYEAIRRYLGHFP
eukprot:m.48271 g.48271  ORF g.48271 m.48271 type:complete len:419 (+) comp47697_c0_seq1:955-2211(+)